MHRRLWLFKSEIILQAPPKNSWLRRDGSCDPWEHRKSFNYIVILQAAKGVSEYCRTQFCWC